MCKLTLFTCRIVDMRKFLILILVLGGTLSFISCKKELPVVTTDTVTSITHTTGTSGGSVIDNGGSDITARGVCWSTDRNPTLSSSTTSDGSGNGSFTSNLTGLSANTSYYVCAYATNSEGTAYGNEVSFRTSPAPLVSLSTSEISSVTPTSATTGGIIINDGGSAITEKGICWSITGNPDISDNKVLYGSGSGNFTINLTGLLPGTKYYVRAYATNAGGTAYGDQVTLLTYISDEDGNIYKTLEIGSRIWMKENLRTTRYNDRSLIPHVTDRTAWGNLTSPAFCWYNNASAYGSIYGALYNWYTVNTNKLCPAGWHVPSDAEWHQLVLYLDTYALLAESESSIAGGKMKEPGNNHWTFYSGISATNESGFTGLPGAYRDEEGGFYNPLGNYGFWWSSTEISPTNAYDRGLRYETNAIMRGMGYKKVGMSIRCVKN